jgi:hypothetical protein
MGYSLDGKANITLTGNTTVNGLAPGWHNLTVYAIDVYGVGGVSENVYFNIIVPFPIALVAGVSFASIAVVAACLFFYRKKQPLIGRNSKV